MAATASPRYQMFLCSGKRCVMLLQGLLLLLLTLAVVILISGWFKGLSAKELVICINAVCLSIGVVIALSRDRWRRNGDFAGKDRR